MNEGNLEDFGMNVYRNVEVQSAKTMQFKSCLPTFQNIIAVTYFAQFTGFLCALRNQDCKQPWLMIHYVKGKKARKHTVILKDINDVYAFLGKEKRVITSTYRKKAQRQFERSEDPKLWRQIPAGELKANMEIAKKCIEVHRQRKEASK